MATSIELLESQRAWAPATKPLDEARWQTWLSKGRAQDQCSSAARIKVIKWAGIAGLFAAAGLWFHLAAATLGTDLSKYRNFELGTDVATVAKQAGVDPSQAKVIHSRPALIQELEWRPQSLGPSSRTESPKDVALSFYNGELYRIVVNYDRYETEGLTSDDFVEAISAVYGIATKAPPSAKPAQDVYAEQEVVLARWQDPEYGFQLVRLSFGPSFRLIGVLKRLEAPAQAAILEAKRLDLQEAPQRDAARILSQEEATRSELEKARLLNRPKFRP